MTHTEYQAKLDEILTRLENQVSIDTSHRIHSHKSGRSPKSIHLEAKVALTKLTEEVVDEVIGKDHLDFTVEDLYADNWIFLNEQKAEQRTTKTKLLRGEL